MDISRSSDIVSQMKYENVNWDGLGRFYSYFLFIIIFLNWIKNSSIDIETRSFFEIFEIKKPIK